DDVERAIGDLNRATPREAPAAGLAGGDGGDLQPGLRVERIVENVTPGGQLRSSELDAQVLTLEFPSGNAAGRPTATTITEPTEMVDAVEEGPNVAVNMTAPTGATQLHVDSVPVIGQVLLADGTPLAAGAVLTPAQAAGLVYVPPMDYLPGTPTG